MLSKIELLLMSIWIILFYHFKETHITRAAHQKNTFRMCFFRFLPFLHHTEDKRNGIITAKIPNPYTNHWPMSPSNASEELVLLLNGECLLQLPTQIYNTFIRHNHRCISIVITNVVKILEFCFSFSTLLLSFHMQTNKPSDSIVHLENECSRPCLVFV